MSVRSLRGALAVTLALLISACADTPAPAPPAPPPAPPPPPSVSLSPRLIEQAAAYRRYMTQAQGITPGFTDGTAIADSLAVGAAYEPGQLVRGAIAYGAVAALQDAAFVEGVRAFVKDPTTRRQISYELIKDPAYAVGLPGSAGAAGLVIAAVGGEGQKLYDEGKAVKQSAYDIQKSAWSKGDVPDREMRLTRAKSLSSASMRGDVAETARLQQASGGSAGGASFGLTASPAAPPYTPAVVRSLAIAALAALGEAGDANLETLLALTAEPNIGQCMNMSKLNLYQCLAVARPHYEDVFCLGQHAMMDTGRCVIRAAGLPEPYEARFVPSQSSIDRGMPDTKKSVPVKRRPKKG